MHRITWHRGSTYSGIRTQYITCVRRRYGNDIDVFDGYEAGTSTKDMTNKRRTGRCASTAVHFTSDMRLQIKILSKKLAKTGCCCFHANEDADLMIVKTALNSSKKIDTILIGEDTDLLVQLCYYFRQEPFGVRQRQTSFRTIHIWG